ncbi:MAG TPA: flavodoxin domain-containing protein [Chitinophagaceae bacterium]|nr:flavodoxin domain-containing protein [Chitinophagaceae bacterium]
MLAEVKLKAFRELVKDATKDELIWMNGFISALAGDIAIAPAPETNGKVNTVSALSGCTIVYGTETGNSKKVAIDFSNRLKKQGVQSKVKSLDQYKVTDLAKESCLLVVISTQGDGEPPAAAKKFYDYILQNELSLNSLKYGVLALGDTSYPLFCQAGEDVDSRLNKLGAERLIELKKCDTDFEEDAQAWINELIGKALAFSTSGTNGVVETKAKPARTGKKIYDGIISSTLNLNDSGSAKETYHIEISSEDEIVYEPGDSIGLVAENNVAAVAKVLELLAIDNNEILQHKEQSYTAVELFGKKINIQHMPERVVQQYARLVNKEIPSIKMDLADLLRIYPPDNGTTPQQVVNILETIAPRLYSISSSAAAHGQGEVHITVCRSSFNIDGQTRYGLCSDYLARLEEGQKVQFYVQKNNSFRLPTPETDVIMIGPGTGVAPFRSFLFEREAQGAEGRNWLFFGDQHFVSDFLYQTELQTFMETGVLTKLNTAFSRDQKHKVYVQHRMQQQANELFSWIENGANIYICGAKDPMSADVEDALLNIIATQKDINKTDAKGYLNNMKEAGRYHKDVY